MDLFEPLRWGPEVTVDKMSVCYQMSITHVSFLSLSLALSEISWVKHLIKQRLSSIFEISHRKIFFVYLRGSVSRHWASRYINLECWKKVYLAEILWTWCLWIVFKKLCYQDIYPLVSMATRPFIIVYYRNDLI